jgi:hypothetical protein
MQEEPGAMLEEKTVTITLWMLVYEDSCCDRWGMKLPPTWLQPFYATSQEEVERKVQDWEEGLACTIRRVSLKEYPDGFMFGWQRLPGRIVSSKESA